jgi:hypothetical protein
MHELDKSDVPNAFCDWQGWWYPSILHPQNCPWLSTSAIVIFGSGFIIVCNVPQNRPSVLLHLFVYRSDMAVNKVCFCADIGATWVVASAEIPFSLHFVFFSGHHFHLDFSW